MCGWNEIEVCTTLAYPHISSFRTMPVLYTSTPTCIHKPFENSELTGLKADIDNEKYTSNNFITTVLLCMCCILHEKTVHDQDDVYIIVPSSSPAKWAVQNELDNLFVHIHAHVHT